MTSIYDFKVSDTNNQSIEMSEYRGKIILIVNVASYCGLTPQYKGCLLYTSPSPRDQEASRMPSSA